MIYLNNAATTYPKPQCVQEACNNFLQQPPTGQFRSAFDESVPDIFTECRKKLGRLLGIKEQKRIFFTSGATEALNKILYGLGIPASRTIVTATEHNSVLRPLYNIPSIQGTPVIVPCDRNGKVHPEELERYIKTDSRALVVNHCSNVTGCIQDMEQIGSIAKKHHLLFIADISQSAGCIPVDVDGWMADAAAFTGHKSLYGIQGSGGYYIRDGISFRPMLFGGNGKDSSTLLYNQNIYEYDAGTQNGVGAAALDAGTGYLLEKGVAHVQKEEQEKMRYLYEELSRMETLILYGSAEENRGPVLSFNLKGLKAADTAYILQNSYGIVSRAGLHCAPLIHSCLETGCHGSVRISISEQNTWKELEQFVSAVWEICRAAG